MTYSCSSAAFAVIVVSGIGLREFEASRNITSSHRNALSKVVHQLSQAQQGRFAALLKANDTAYVQVNIGKNMILSQGG